MVTNLLTLTSTVRHLLAVGGLIYIYFFFFYAQISLKGLWWRRRRGRRRRGGFQEASGMWNCWNLWQTCHSNISSSQHFLDHVTRHVVEEKSQQGQQQQSRDNLDGQPLVLVADQVFHGFERSEEPQQAGVWAAGEDIRKRQHNKNATICMLVFLCTEKKIQIWTGCRNNLQHVFRNNFKKRNLPGIDRRLLVEVSVNKCLSSF